MMGKAGPQHELSTIAIFRAYPDPVMAALGELGEVLEFDLAADLCADPRWQHVDAAFVAAFDRLDGAAIAAAGSLRWVSSIGAGLDHIDLAACTSAGITVRNTPQATVEPTADHIFALLLATARGIPEGDAFVRSGAWAGGTPPRLGLDIAGQTLGIVGMGRIGRAIARRAAAFGMDIAYHDQAPLSAAELGGLAARWLPLDHLLEQADAILLQAPLTPQTRHMIGASAFARMKPEAIVINGGRGGVLDEDALVDALEAGTIARAGLDVFENEPQVNPRLLGCPNLVMTPHIGTATARARHAMMLEALDNLRELLGGGG